MAKRKLRKGTRKNYEKMASGEDGDCNGEQEPCFSGTKSTRDGERENNNKQSFSDEDEQSNGGIIGTEFVLSASEDEGENGIDLGGGNTSDDCDGDDEAIQEAREKLAAIRKEHQRLSKKTKKSKLDKITQEVEKAEKSLQKLKKKHQKVGDRKKEGKTVLTASSLRDMGDVMLGVDKLMDKKLNLNKKVVNSDSSSDSESSNSFSDSSSSTSSSSSSDIDGDRKKKRKSHKKKKSKSAGKKKSGKSKRLTSYVKYPQKWPHSVLSLHFVSKEKKYEDLTIAEFCAGYSTILEMCSERTRVHRTAHLKEIMYLATKYQWRCVLNYHAAVLLEIERGHLRWGDSFQILQNTTLAGGFLHQNRLNGSNSSSRPAGLVNGSPAPISGPSNGKDEGTAFCRGFQRGICKQAREHYGWLNGENRLLKHICAKCWLRSRIIANHPETDEKCPHKDEP